MVKDFTLVQRIFLFPPYLSGKQMRQGGNHNGKIRKCMTSQVRQTPPPYEFVGL